MRRLFQPLASLRLTVILMACAMVLIFVGTLAQTRIGVWEAVDTYFRVPVAWVDAGLLIRGAGWSVPIPGGLLITVAMIVNLLAAHAVRFRASRRKVGILVLHAGLIVLLAGELVAGFASDEGLMTIDEGGRSAVLEDVRAVELAVLDPRDPETDRVVVVPAELLEAAARSGEPIRDARLPFDILVSAYRPRAQLVNATGATPATAGVGLEAAAVDAPRGDAADTPASYVTLTREGETLGTWLVSAALRSPQAVVVGDDTFGVALRFARTVLPYTLHLDDFRHDVFPGTQIARNFSSDVRLVDPVHETDRTVRIWMNHPLRYAGRTFYQSSYKPDGSGTVLQVVRNPGAWLPYIACGLVGGGMVLQFAQSLIGFLRRHRRDTTAAARRAAPVGVAPAVRGPCWPWAVAGLGVVLAMSAGLRPVHSDGWDTHRFGQIPVTAGGRVKPLDTAARNLLMVVGGRQGVTGDGVKVTASRYLLDLVARPDAVENLKVLRVDHTDVLGMLGLAPEDGGRLSLAAVRPHWDDVAQQAARAAAVPAAERDGFQRAVLELHRRVNTVLSYAQLREPLTVVPTDAASPWRDFHAAFLDEMAGEIADEGSDNAAGAPGGATPSPSVAYFASMLTAAGQDDGPAFNAAVGDYLDVLETSMPTTMRRARLEQWFNRAQLFSGSAAVYLLALLGVCFSFVLRARPGGDTWAERLRAGSAALLSAAVLVHTAAIVLRVVLQDRPPVTNLYSSAVFVGWAAALTGWWLERLFPLGVATLTSAVIGCGTLIVAHNLGSDGDTMQMMQAVLDSNFWLATHVITITLGYAATLLAGGLGGVYLVARVWPGALDRPRELALGRMTYGVVCFALLLSFVGTVLGGIWADQSWGRFWGWDPKENGAALVVLINAIVLHARWGGMVRARGVAVLAVAGSIVTAWSWFGTNLLGVGLHAYGFMDAAARWLWIFVGSQLVLMALVLGPAARPRKAQR